MFLFRNVTRVSCMDSREWFHVFFYRNMGDVWRSDHRRGKISPKHINLKTAWIKIIYKLREVWIKETEAALPPFFPLLLFSSPADGWTADDSGLRERDQSVRHGWGLRCRKVSEPELLAMPCLVVTRLWNICLCSSLTPNESYGIIRLNHPCLGCGNFLFVCLFLLGFFLLFFFVWTRVLSPSKGHRSGTKVRQFIKHL